MIVLKGMELQTDCKKCPLMATDRVDLLSPMMCLALWATRHEVKYCVEGKILNDCPLVEIVTCKDCKHCCHITDAPKVLLCEKHNCQQVSKNFYCKDGERRE